MISKCIHFYIWFSKNVQNSMIWLDTRIYCTCFVFLIAPYNIFNDTIIMIVRSIRINSIIGLEQNWNKNY